jgi:hypothetical protein
MGGEKIYASKVESLLPKSKKCYRGQISKTWSREEGKNIACWVLPLPVFFAF